MSKNYMVTITRKFPAYGERAGELEIYAKNKADAISAARNQAAREMWFGRQDGPIIYKAEEAA